MRIFTNSHTVQYPQVSLIRSCWATATPHYRLRNDICNELVIFIFQRAFLSQPCIIIIAKILRKIKFCLDIWQYNYQYLNKSIVVLEILFYYAKKVKKVVHICFLVNGQKL